MKAVSDSGWLYNHARHVASKCIYPSWLLFWITVKGPPLTDSLIFKHYSTSKPLSEWRKSLHKCKSAGLIKPTISASIVISLYYSVRMIIMKNQRINWMPFLICLLFVIVTFPAPAAADQGEPDVTGADTGSMQISDIDDFTIWSGAPVVDITGINALNFPQVITYVTVNTPAGRSGALSTEDFAIYENGNLMDISFVQFPDSSAITKLDLAIVFDEDRKSVV